MSTTTDKLEAMFPDLSRDVIQAVLHQHKGKESAAIDALLKLGDTQLGRKERLGEVIDRVLSMATGSCSNGARLLAGKFGLDIMTVAWEDNARSKNSAWGPCISDMTLNVLDRPLPLVRHSNFADLTWDVPMEKIPLVVGNEIVGGQLYTITLMDYLTNLRLYLNKPQSWQGSQTSLYSEAKDSHVIMSAQACFLPVPHESDATFNVSIYNYQSRAGDPAVLAIVATTHGTSAQVVERGTQKLYFNKAGQRASFVGQRLSDNRRERGVAVEGEMTSEEKQQNMIMIIQVPLKRRQPEWRGSCELNEGLPIPPCLPMPTSCGISVVRSRSAPDVEDAIVKVGESEGVFQEINNLEIERDHEFPVRVTLQFYKSTANGVADENAMRTIAEQIKSSRKFADNVGSLVVGGHTNRPTEHSVHHNPVPVIQPPPPVIYVPSWWDTFWLTYRNTLGSPTGTHWVISEEEAKQVAFGEGGAAKWAQSTLQSSQNDVLSRLRAYAGQAPLPQWSVLG